MKRSYQKKNQVRVKKKFLLSAFFKLACRLITIEENFSISFFVLFFSATKAPSKNVDLAMDKIMKSGETKKKKEKGE